MSLISITSDYGLKDGTPSKIKAKLLTEDSSVNIVDVSHEVEPFNLVEAAYIVKSNYWAFPKKSVHLVLVDAMLHPKEQPIAALINDHYFIAKNNGILSMIEPSLKPQQMVELTFIREDTQNNESLETLFCKAAIFLVNNGNLSVLGQKMSHFKTLTAMQPVTQGKVISGSIIYQDNYGNAISNVSLQLFKEVGKGRDFRIKAGHYTFDKLVQNYSDIVQNFEKENDFHGNKMALFNDNNMLEIAMYKSNKKTVGGASQLLGLYVGSNIIVEFL